MCYRLPIDKILLNYFASNPGIESISFGQLDNLSRKIIQKCGNSINVNVNRDTIISAVAERSDVFEISNDEVRIIDRESYPIQNLDVINNSIPSEIIGYCKAACEEYGD